MSGLKLAALFGFYPHKLGFCGLQENSAKKTLLSYLSGEKIPEQKIRKILETFKGAFSYYKLIAKSNRIEDPFDEKVVKAYWIGNQLLEKVPVDSLKEMIIKEFVGPGFLSKKIAEKKAKEVPLTSKAHHSFHVLVMGSVSDRIILEGKLLDLCRIAWGKVIRTCSLRSQDLVFSLCSEIGYKKRGTENPNRIIIEYQPLQKRRKKYFLGEPIHKIVFWEKKFIPEIKIGDKVATHWNHIVQILSPKDLNYLKKYTQITIDSLNG
ncbi:MAG: DUF6390 family protein [Microgenomates group bacterium]